MGSLRKTGLSEDQKPEIPLPLLLNPSSVICSKDARQSQDSESIIGPSSLATGTDDNPPTSRSPAEDTVPKESESASSFLDKGTLPASLGHVKVASEETDKDARTNLDWSSSRITSSFEMPETCGGSYSIPDLLPDPETYFNIITLSTSSSDASDDKSNDNDIEDRKSENNEVFTTVVVSSTPRKKKKHPIPLILNPNEPQPVNIQVKDSSTDDEDESNVPLGKRILAKASKKKMLQNRYKEMKEDKQVLTPIEHPIPSTSAHLRREQARLQKLNASRGNTKSRPRTTTKRGHDQRQGSVKIIPKEQNKRAKPAVERRTKGRAVGPLVPESTKKEDEGSGDDVVILTPPTNLKITPSESVQNKRPRPVGPCTKRRTVRPAGPAISDESRKEANPDDNFITVPTIDVKIPVEESEQNKRTRPAERHTKQRAVTPAGAAFTESTKEDSADDIVILTPPIDVKITPMDSGRNKRARPAGRRTKRRVIEPAVPDTTDESVKGAKTPPIPLKGSPTKTPPIPVKGSPIKRSVVRKTTVTIVVTDVVTFEAITTEEEEIAGETPKVTSSKATIRYTRSKANSVSEPEPTPDSSPLKSARKSKSAEAIRTTVRRNSIEEVISAVATGEVSGITVKTTNNGPIIPNEPIESNFSVTSGITVNPTTNNGAATNDDKPSLPPIDTEMDVPSSFTLNAELCDDKSESIISPVLQPITKNEKTQSVCSNTTEDSDDDIIQPVIVLRKVKMPTGRISSPDPKNSLVLQEEESEKLPNVPNYTAAAKNSRIIRVNSSNNLQPVVRLKRLNLDEPLLYQPAKKKKEDLSIIIIPKEVAKPDIEEIRKSVRTRRPRTAFELI